MRLPSHHLIYDFLLLVGGFAQINARGFYALVSHQVSKKSQIIILFKKILGEAVTERVGVDNLCIHSVFSGKDL